MAKRLRDGTILSNHSTVRYLMVLDPTNMKNQEILVTFYSNKTFFFKGRIKSQVSATEDKTEKKVNKNTSFSPLTKC